MTIHECAETLSGYDKIMILTHARPDGDTLGSAAALCAALRRAGKNAWLYPNPEITERYTQYVQPFLGEQNGADRVISVDLADEGLYPKGFEGKIDLCIDHHPGDHAFAPLVLTNPEKASCGEIVMEIIEDLCGNLTPEEASLLYIALSTDCGCFVYGNTRADTHIAAAHLIDCGADHHTLNRALFRSFSYARLKLEGFILADMKSYLDNAVNVALVTLHMMEKSGATEDDCEDLASLAGKVRGNRVAITVRELAPGKSKASLRTDGSVDAREICQRFGGGGHKMASGCTVNTDPSDLAERLMEVVREVWPG